MVASRACGNISLRALSSRRCVEQLLPHPWNRTSSRSSACRSCRIHQPTTSRCCISYLMPAYNAPACLGKFGGLPPIRSAVPDLVMLLRGALLELLPLPTITVLVLRPLHSQPDLLPPRWRGLFLVWDFQLIATAFDCMAVLSRLFESTIS